MIETNESSLKVTETKLIEIEDEYGVIDYQDMVEEYMADSIQSLNKIADATTWVGSQFTKKATEIKALTLNGNQPSRKILKNLYTRTAKIMEDFNNRIQPEIPIFFDYFEKATDAFSNLINLYRSDLQIDQNEVDEVHESICELKNGISASINGMSGFLESIQELPRMSKEMNAARSKLINNLENLLNNLNVSYSITLELEKSIENII